MKKLIKMVFSLVVLGCALYFVYCKYDLGTLISQWAVEDTVKNDTEYIAKLRQAMLNREEDVELKFKGTSEEAHKFVSEAINKVFAIDKSDTDSDADYLKHCYKGTKITIKGVLNSYTVNYKFEYFETKEQTQAVDNRIKRVLAEKDIKNKDDYEKIKTIHDYIVTNATYDENEKRNSAYDNLINQSSVCQGYAMVTYKMMKAAGIDCRIITGRGKGVNHAWNIVKLKGKWYNIDCTWDDPISEDKSVHLVHDYFLKSDADFRDHIRDKEFETIEFTKKYKMADISY